MCPTLFQVLVDKLGDKTNVPVTTGNFFLIGVKRRSSSRSTSGGAGATKNMAQVIQDKKSR